MRMGEFAKAVGYSDARIRQLLLAGEKIPGHRVTKGGHHYFTECAGLEAYIKKKKTAREKRGNGRGKPPDAINKPSLSSMPQPDKGLTLIQATCQYFNVNRAKIMALPSFMRRQWKQRLKPFADLYDQL